MCETSKKNNTIDAKQYNDLPPVVCCEVLASYEMAKVQSSEPLLVQVEEV